MMADLSASGRAAFAALHAAAADGRYLAARSVDAARASEVFTFARFEDAFAFLAEEAGNRADWAGWEQLTVELRHDGKRLLVECAHGVIAPSP